MRKELEQELQLQPYIVCCLEESTLLIWNMPNAIVIPFAKLKTATVNKSSISAVSTDKKMGKS